MSLLDQLHPTATMGLHTDLQAALDRIRGPQSLGTPVPSYADVTPSTSPLGPSPVPAAPAAPTVPTTPSQPLDSLRASLDSRLGSLAFSPSTQLPQDVTAGSVAQILNGVNPFASAISAILNGGQGGKGSAMADIQHAIAVRQHQLSSGTSTIPSGGPTSSIDYASLPGMYGHLVDPPGGPSDLRLQAGTASSLKGILPYGAILGGSYRTYAQQAADYAKDPNRFAPPGTSLHEYGLAIDVNTGYLAAHPDVRQKLLNAGWYQERPDESWHFSYGVFAPAPQTTRPGNPGNPGRSAPARTPQRTLSPQAR